MKKNEDRSGLAIGGGLLLGIGVGFFVLKVSALHFVGSVLAGLGIGLIIGALLKKK